MAPKRSVLKSDQLTTTPEDVIIEFGITWKRRGVIYGQIGGRWGITLDMITGEGAEELRAEIMELVQQAAEKVEPPEGARD